MRKLLVASIALVLLAGSFPASGSATALPVFRRPGSSSSSVRRSSSSVRKSSSSSVRRVSPAKPASSARSSVASTKAASSVHAFPYALPITDDWQKQWKIHPIEGTPESLKNVAVFHEGSSPALRVQFPQGSADRSVWKMYGKKLGGVAAWVDPAITASPEMFLRYSVRFPKDFDFSLPGSLPGIFTGLQNNRDEGSAGSAYVVWGKGGEISVSGGFTKKQPNASTMTTVGKLVADGQWHRLDLHVRLNTQTGKANGLIELRLDGVLIGNAADIIFRNKTNDRFDGLGLFAVYGGMDVLSSAPRDLSLDLAGFTISDKPLP